MKTAPTLARRLATTAFVGVALYYAVWGGEYSTLDLYRLAERQKAESARLEATLEQVDSMKALVGRLESDPATIEALARERFGMIRPGELLYRFVPVEEETLPIRATAAQP